MSDTTRVKLAYAQESSFGVQVTGQNLQTIRKLTEDLALAAEVHVSGELASDRQISSVRRVRSSTAGPVNFELSYGTYDDWLAAALCSANVKAQGTLTLDVIPSDGNTMTIGTTVYRFKDTPAQANDIQIAAGGSALADTQASIVATINGTGTAGTDYYAGTTTPHPLVRASAFATNVCTLTALAAGLAGNAIATTETFTPETDVFNGGTLGTTTAGAGWTAPVTVSAATISASAVDNSFNDSANGFGSIVAGQWIKVSGFASAANNGYFKVSTATAAKLVVTGGTLVTVSATPTITVKQGSSIVNGTTLNTFNIERTYEDLSNDIALFLGMAVGSVSIDVPTTGAVTGVFNFMGASESSETASGGDGYEDATETRGFTSLDLENLFENAGDMSIRSFSLALDNQIHQRLIAGPSGVQSIGTGPIRLEGSLEAYYSSKTLYDKYVNETASSLAIALEDPDGNAYVIEMPQVVFSVGNRSSAQNPDVLARMNWSAYKDPTEDITIRISRFAA